MTAQPRWEDSGQGDLLELVAQGSPSTGTAEEEWETFSYALRFLARGNRRGLVTPNLLRPIVREHVAPQRRGAFINRALSRGLIEPAGWEVSDDHEGKNAGRPARVYRWIGGAL